MDSQIISALKRDGRASLSELAAELGITRTTVRTRLHRLQERGDIVGFTALTRADVVRDPVRGLMMLAISGRGTERIIDRLSGLPEVRCVHSTNGIWDLIVELGTDTLETLDKALFTIRRMDGVDRSETNLLLSTRQAGRRR